MAQMQPFTLARFAQTIAELAKEHPDAIIVYASDEEGNSFHPSYFAPQMGMWREQWREWAAPDDDNLADPDYKLNACCIN